MRVFHLIKSLGRGGAEMLLSEGLRFANRNQFEYAYGYFLPWKNALVPNLEQQQVSVHCFGARNNAAILLSAPRVARFLKQWRADLLHCHLPVAGAVGRVAGKLADVPVVYTEHNKMERYHGLTRQLNLATWHWQQRVIAVSEDVRQSVEHFAGNRVRVEVVRNGVDVGRFEQRQVDDTAIRRQMGIPLDAPVIGTVAVFRVQKQLDDWLRAAAILHARYPQVRFILVGDGPLRQELHDLATSIGLKGVLHFAGLQKDVREYLAAIDVYLMSSRFEGLPVALLEAMSMACTPVCTAVGGIPEVIRSGENGLLAPPGHPEALAHAVESLLESPGTLERWGAAARQTVVHDFSMERMARQLENIYRGVDEARLNG